jgi:voltage-gated potassium channel Kch
VIIATTDSVPTHLWDSISQFQKIYLIYGSPLDKEVLKRANINKADKAVILQFDPAFARAQ